MNTMMYVSLKTIVENTKEYKLGGITLDRLEVLGDAVLDLLFVWSIYCNIADQHVHQINDKNESKAQFKEYMTNGRHIFVNNNSLGYHFFKRIYENTQGLWWFDGDRAMKHEISEYSE